MLEWVRIWPEWAEVMNDLRSKRLETTVYPLRRCLLVSEYNRYVTHPLPDSPTFHFLPHVTDLASFSPFKDIIENPEQIQMNDKPFASAFAQLPVLIDEWLKTLNSEIAGLVKIPAHLSVKASEDRNKAPGSINPTDLFQADLDKLHLACAIFRVDGTGAFAYPEVLSVSMRHDMVVTAHQTTLMSIIANGVIHGLQFLEEAPYIIHACGLDPSVATARDMDHRNARLRCLSCAGRTLIMNWRHAVRLVFY